MMNVWQCIACTVVLECNGAHGDEYAQCVGDIEDLLLRTLTQSRLIMEEELCKQFRQRDRVNCRDLWIPMLKCVMCHQRLYNQASVVILGHAPPIYRRNV